MKRIVFSAVLFLFALALHAQRVSGQFNNVSMADALQQLSSQTDDYVVSFLYNDLEDFRVTTSIQRKPLPDAIRQLIGFYPIRMTVADREIVVECTHKTDRHLRGTVVDEHDQPVAYANITLLHPADSTVLCGGVSNESGVFVIPVEQPTVIARITYVGYQTVWRMCSSEQVGTIRLEPETMTIGGVVVKGNRRIIKHQTDRLQYIVGADEFARGLTAQELMRRVPLLEIKGDDVAMVGKSSTHFLLNGREMPDNMLKSKLSTLRSEDIERIEVISIPPSKYKAEPNAGYVNIVLHRDQTLGVNGSIGGSLIFKERTSSVLTPAVNYANKRLDISFSGMLDLARGRNDRSWEAVFADHTKTSASVNRFNWTWGDANLLVKYQLSKRWSAGFLGSASSTKANIDVHDITDERNVRTTTDTHSPDDKSYSLSGEVFADFVIDPKGKMLTLTYDYLNNYQQQDQRLEAVTAPSSPTTQHPSPTTLNMLNTGDSRYRIDGVKADAMLTYAWANIETGAAYTNIGNRSSLDIFSDATGVWKKTDGQSNHFDYKERTAAAYMSAQRDFSSKFSAKAGLRIEKTWTEGTLVENDETNRNHYLYLFPTLHLRWKPTDRANFGLAYSKGISRPDFNDLNPFRYYQTPTSYVSGNPFLAPGLTDNVEVNFSNGRGLYAVLYESHQRDAAGLPMLFTADGIQSSVADNCFSTDKAGLYVEWRRNLLTWWNVQLGGEVFFAQSHVTKPSSNLQDEHQWSGKAELNTDWFLNHSHTLMLNAYYTHQLPQVDTYGRYEKSYVFCGAKLSYRLLNDRLLLSLAVSDPFHQNFSRSTNHYNGYTVHFRNDARVQNVNIYVRYSFGGSKVRRSYRQSKNTDASRAAAR